MLLKKVSRCLILTDEIDSHGKLTSSAYFGGNFSLQHLSHLNPFLFHLLLAMAFGIITQRMEIGGISEQSSMAAGDSLSEECTITLVKVG